MNKADKILGLSINEDENLLDSKMFEKVGNEWIKFNKLMSDAIKQMKSSKEKGDANKLHRKAANLIDEFMEVIGATV